MVWNAYLGVYYNVIRFLEWFGAFYRQKSKLKVEYQDLTVIFKRTSEVCILVQIGPPSAKIGIGTHWNTVFNVFWPVESIRDANYGQKSFQSAHLAVSMLVVRCSVCLTTPFKLVHFEPPSAKIDIGTHKNTFLDVFLCVESIYGVQNDIRVH